MRHAILACIILSLAVVACDEAATPLELRDANTKGVYIDTYSGAAIGREAVIDLLQACGKQGDPPQRLTLEWEDGPGVGTGIRNTIHIRQTMALAEFELLQCYTQIFSENDGIKIPE